IESRTTCTGPLLGVSLVGSVRSGSRGTKSLFVEPSLPGRSPVFSGVCTASEAQDLGLSSSGRTRSDRSLYGLFGEDLPILGEILGQDTISAKTLVDDVQLARAMATHLHD